MRARRGHPQPELRLPAAHPQVAVQGREDFFGELLPGVAGDLANQARRRHRRGVGEGNRPGLADRRPHRHIRAVEWEREPVALHGGGPAPAGGGAERLEQHLGVGLKRGEDFRFDQPPAPGVGHGGGEAGQRHRPARHRAARGPDPALGRRHRGDDFDRDRPARPIGELVEPDHQPPLRVEGNGGRGAESRARSQPGHEPGRRLRVPRVGHKRDMCLFKERLAPRRVDPRDQADTRRQGHRKGFRLRRARGPGRFPKHVEGDDGDQPALMLGHADAIGCRVESEPGVLNPVGGVGGREHRRQQLRRPARPLGQGHFLQHPGERGPGDGPGQVGDRVVRHRWRGRPEAGQCVEEHVLAPRVGGRPGQPLGERIAAGKVQRLVQRAGERLSVGGDGDRLARPEGLPQFRDRRDARPGRPTDGRRVPRVRRRVRLGDQGGRQPLRAPFAHLQGDRREHSSGGGGEAPGHRPRRPDRGRLAGEPFVPDLPDRDPRERPRPVAPGPLPGGGGAVCGIQEAFERELAGGRRRRGAGGHEQARPEVGLVRANRHRRRRRGHGRVDQFVDPAGRGRPPPGPAARPRPTRTGRGRPGRRRRPARRRPGCPAIRVLSLPLPPPSRRPTEPPGRPRPTAAAPRRPTPSARPPRAPPRPRVRRPGPVCGPRAGGRRPPQPTWLPRARFARRRLPWPAAAGRPRPPPPARAGRAGPLRPEPEPRPPAPAPPRTAHPPARATRPGRVRASGVELRHPVRSDWVSSHPARSPSRRRCHALVGP